jgi:general secretion pathway protein F
MNAAGKPQKGMLDAESPRALKEALKKKGIFLIEHVEGSKKQAISKGEGINREIDFGKLLGSRIPAVEIAMLTRQLATLQRAGVPLI